jgi:polysaccharide export outer membrane protein
MHSAGLGLWLALAAAEALAPTATYRLGPGDVIDIAVFEVEELSKPAILAPDGTVTLVGAVELGGPTARQAGERLRTLYANHWIRNPQIAVAVREYHSQPVVVLGAVARPGVYQLRGRRRLSDVLAVAEGLAPDAGSEITILRPRPPAGDQILTVATRDLMVDNPWVEALDTVRVSKAGIVYVVGEVERAGGFPLKDQEAITVLKALSLAARLRPTAARQQARIIRTTTGGAREEVPVRVGDILDGRAPDLVLAPHDVLFIPHSQARRAAARAAEAAIQLAAGVVIWRR